MTVGMLMDYRWSASSFDGVSEECECEKDAMIVRIITICFSFILVTLAIGDYFSETISPRLTFEILTAFAIAIGVLLIPDVEELRIKEIFHFKRRITVAPATEDDVMEATKEELEAAETTQDRQKKDAPVDFRGRARALHMLEHRALSVLTSQWPQGADVSMNAVKLELPEADPALGRSSIVFDGYIKWQGVEQFIEVKRASVPVGLIRHQISRQLVAIQRYAKFSKVEARLKLVLIFLPDDQRQTVGGPPTGSGQDRADYTLRRLRNEFADAIEEGLLELVPFPFSQKDLDSLGVDIQ